MEHGERDHGKAGSDFVNLTEKILKIFCAEALTSLPCTFTGSYNVYSNAETIMKGATTMKLMKIPFKILALPVIALIWLTCFLAKAVTHISCYVIGPFMLLVGIILIVMLTKSRWADVGICGAIEGVCLLALFGVTWMIANMEDLNALLIRFVQS